jgi:hypothetical protein
MAQPIIRGCATEIQGYLRVVPLRFKGIYGLNPLISMAQPIIRGCAIEIQGYLRVVPLRFKGTYGLCH